MKPYTPNPFEKYVDEGYVLLKGFYSPSRVERALEYLSQCATRALEREGDLHANLQALRELFPERYSNLLNAFVRSMTLRELLFNDPSLMNLLTQLQLIEPVYTTYPVSHLISEDLWSNPNKPGEIVGSPWHQDWASMQGSLNALTCWIPLLDVGENFPLQCIAGSHRDGLRPHEDHGNTFPEAAPTPTQQQNIVTLHCERGDMVIFSSFLLHRTRPQSAGSSGFRAAVSIRFDDMSDESYRNRDYYCAYRHTVDREIRTFPTSEEIVHSIKKGNEALH
tara:strand:- start:42936 stop:43772 length:837 start_codon:yes stop_codon:yes gene_type:complete